MAGASTRSSSKQNQGSSGEVGTNKKMAQRLSPELELVISAAGIYFFYVYYGILQEKIYRPDPETGDRFSYTMFLLTVQCFFNFLLGALALRFFGGLGTEKDSSETAMTSPLGPIHSGRTWLALTSFSYLCAMGCSNQSLQYVSYPFQALAKSCKMVPVMLGNVIIGGKRYSALEYLCVFLITAGVSLFQFAKSNNTNFMEGNSWFGMALLFGSLTLDGVTGSNQKMFTDEFKPSSLYMMMAMNFWSLVFLVPLLAVSGEGFAGMTYVMDHSQLIEDILSFAACSACGQLFIFFCVVGPGPLACTTITTTRKFFTVLVSVFMYPDNALNTYQWIAVLLVFTGLSLEVVNKYTSKNKHKTKKQ